MSDRPTTQLATASADDVTVRGKSLPRDLMGKLTFTEMSYLLIVGEPPTAAQTAVVDACLVTLAEHGMTPSAAATRLIYTSAPEAPQAAVAAGLLGVGSLFVGTVEGCAKLVARIVAAGDTEAEARAVATEHKEQRLALPGFGHPQHKPDDPRTPRLFEIAEEHDVAGAHLAALRALSAAVDDVYGKHITVNATGAVGAALADAGVPIEIMRGFAILARCAGLVAHVREEQQDPGMLAIWRAAEEAVPYTGEG